VTTSGWTPRWRRLRDERGVTVALVCCALLLLVGVGGAWIAPYDPTALLDPLDMRSQPPSWRHPLGTDPYSRDILSRIIAGARVSLGLAVGAIVLATTIGVAVGVGSAFAGGRTDRVVMRLVDVALAVPRVVLLLTVTSVVGTLPLAMLAVLLGATGWFGLSRLVRGEVLALRTQDRFVAARALGVPPLALVRRHVLPDLVPLIAVTATTGLGRVLLLESSLSFLGLGVAPPTASWGSVLLDVSDVVGDSRWLAVGPGLVITITVVAMQRLGDALQSVLDVRLSR